MGTFDRIAQHDDELGRRDEFFDPLLGISVIEVKRGGFALEHSTGCRVKQRLIVAAAPDVLAVGFRVTRAAFTRRWPVSQEELRLFDRRQVQLGMPGQGRVQGRGPSFGYAGDEEVRQRHPTALPSQR